MKGDAVVNEPRRRPAWRNPLILVGILGTAVLLSMALSGLHDDNNPFAMPVFILAVALVARLTEGYPWGIAASLVSTFCVNYMFTYPFWEFDVTLTGYPLTFAMMLVVSLFISTLTTQVKKQEQLRFEAEREKMRANLLRAIAGEDVSINNTNADVTGDGAVDLKDVLLILQYIAGWNVSLQ